MVLICGDERKEVYKGFWPQDCSCAAQNMQLAAHEQGVGAVWIAVYPDNEQVVTASDDGTVRLWQLRQIWSGN